MSRSSSAINVQNDIAGKKEWCVRRSEGEGEDEDEDEGEAGGEGEGEE